MNTITLKKNIKNVLEENKDTFLRLPLFEIEQLLEVKLNYKASKKVLPEILKIIHDFRWKESK